MRQLLWIGLGSGLGGSLRYIIDWLALQVGEALLPLSTFVINVTGSLLIGYLAGQWAMGDARGPHPHRWHFWVAGFCGGYTTFSTFSAQVLELVEQGEGTLAGAYAAGSVALGLISVWFGLSLALRGRTTA